MHSRPFRRTLLAFALPLALASHPALSETPAAGEPIVLKPGAATVSGAFIQPCTNRWSVAQVKPDGTTKPVGTWTDDVKVETMNGRPVIKRQQTATFGDTEVKYLNVVDRGTMAPILSEQSSSKGLFEHFDFDGTHVKYRHAAMPSGGAIEEKDIQLTMPVYQFGGMFGMLLVTFPLREGAVFKFPNFDVTQADNVEWLAFRVKGKEMVPAGAGKKVEAWIVESEPKPGAKMRFSLTKEAPYIIRLEQEKDGAVVRWEMI
ncbi:MAG TPA: hypothetical protein VFE33_28470 [Thermoanaerobaculia bacterium]|nr:hypothetical protein [Thermoanaerobaculia bacterium]